MADGPSSDADFAIARRAVERRWLSEAQVEAAVLKREKDPARRLIDCLPLTPLQISELSGPASSLRLPDEVERLITDPAKRVGKYVVTAPLGAGGMGMVVKAYDTQLRRWTALKFLKAIGDDQARAFFEREAQLAAGLTHPHIAAIYETGDHNGQPFIAMQFVDGQNLHAARTRMSPADVVAAVRKIAEAVRHAHEQSVIHRDLKPSNVMIDAKGHVYVMDFGLAKETSLRSTERSLTGTNAVIGTPSYMAPEQARGKADAQSDLYGIGAIFYELCTGRPPFTGETTPDILMQVVQDDPILPRKLNPSLTADVEAVILHALEKDKARRYATADQMIEDLEALAAKNPLKHARRTTFAYLLARKIRKQPLLWALGAAAAVAMVAGAATWVHSLSNEAFAGRRIRGLADVKKLRDFREAANTLWPATADRVPRIEAWLADARDLVSRLPAHRRHLASLPAPESATPEEAWERETLEGLLRDLESFARPPSTDGPPLNVIDTSLAAVNRRLEFARAIRKQSIEDHRDAWVAVCTKTNITPQTGLVPLGQDPASGLWEFADIQTGRPPARSGALTLAPETGVVFVLVPGGKFIMGSRTSLDPGTQENEFPAREVTLAPFFISKYEITQAQWVRLTGENPSRHPAGRKIGGKVVTPLHPVESVSWFDAQSVFERLGFVLPTEAQWEYATRGGTTTPYWTGLSHPSLQGAVNIADGYALSHDGDRGLTFEPWLDDGYTAHAPVGSYRANPFGLHDTAGNVWEWCRDFYGPYTNPCEPPDGERTVTGQTSRVLRGGGLRSDAKQCRSAFRGDNNPTTKLEGLGVRPGRRILP